MLNAYTICSATSYWSSLLSLFHKQLTVTLCTWHAPRSPVVLPGLTLPQVGRKVKRAKATTPSAIKAGSVSGSCQREKKRRKILALKCQRLCRWFCPRQKLACLSWLLAVGLHRTVVIGFAAGLWSKSAPVWSYMNLKYVEGRTKKFKIWSLKQGCSLNNVLIETYRPISRLRLN